MKSVKEVFSILAISVVILVLALNINLKLNLTGNVVETTTSLATVTTSYIYGNGLVASYDRDENGQYGNEKFYINDHLGSGSVVIDENGNVTSSESYYAFGEEKLSEGSEDSRFTYTGKEKDDSGLYYYGARYYDADSGRFLQPDPLTGSVENPQSLNRYTYVTNNPHKYVDPSGMSNEVLEGDLAPSPHRDAIKNRIEHPTTGDAIGTGAFMMLLGGWAVGQVGGALLANPATLSEVSTTAVETALGDAAGTGVGVAVGANIGALKRTTYQAMGYEEIIKKGEVSIWGKVVKIFRPNGYDEEMELGDEILNVHFENSGNRGKKNIQDALDTFDQLKEKSVQEGIVVTGDTPTRSLINIAEKKGAIVRDLPVYPERLVSRMVGSDTKRFIFRPPKE
ncbi:MAG TPA: RHS repeat-associated core domain-containing protein [Candidatus Nanoarchaeia archaeon]|nr:RHS repeat-associated core domain-containing protein [Candidatus Nanoarchaeia archaeon]